LLPFAENERRGLRELKPTKMIIQLANRSTRLPVGMVEDMLIKVEKLIYPLDFVVLGVENMASTASQIPIILGHPFLATPIALINCRNHMMRLSFVNMTLELSNFHMLR